MHIPSYACPFDVCAPSQMAGLFDYNVFMSHRISKHCWLLKIYMFPFFLWRNSGSQIFLQSVFVRKGTCEKLMVISSIHKNQTIRRARSVLILTSHLCLGFPGGFLVTSSHLKLYMLLTSASACYTTRLCVIPLFDNRNGTLVECRFYVSCLVTRLFRKYKVSLMQVLINVNLVERRLSERFISRCGNHLIMHAFLHKNALE
jgi:hypothetical protein